MPIISFISDYTTPRCPQPPKGEAQNYVSIIVFYLKEIYHGLIDNAFEQLHPLGPGQKAAKR
jgi:hypothetical protein